MDRPTRVVHVNSPEFRDDPTAVYIGRAVRRAKEPRARVNSIWRNPFPINEDLVRQDAIAMFERRVQTLLREGGCGLTVDDWIEPAEWGARLMGLRGKALGCWCAPNPCHGDVLVRVIERLSGESAR